MASDGNKTGRRSDGKFAAGHSGNPQGRAATQRVNRSDSWQSLLTGIGTQRDKRTSMSFVAERITPQQAEEIWMGDDLAARIIEILPREETREGFDFCATDEQDDGQGPDVETGEGEIATSEAEDYSGLKREIEHQWDELGVLKKIYDARCYARAYGGGAIFIGANDGATDLTEPLQFDRVRSIDFLTALDPREITPVSWYDDPQAAGGMYMEPEIYQLTGTSSRGVTQVHESRLGVFRGIRVSRRQRLSSSGWDESILTRIYHVLRDYNLSFAAAGNLVVDFAQAVLKIDDLDSLLEDDPLDKFKNRMLGMNLARSVANTVLIGSTEEFTRVTTPLTGLPEMMDRFTQRLSMASEIPLMLLASEGPAGLNGSGASNDQLRMFYDLTRARQIHEICPVMRKITKCQLAALGAEPAQWSIDPRPLWQPTQAEQVATRQVQANIDAAYLDRSVLSAEEVRRSRFGSRQDYSFVTMLTPDPVMAAPDDSDESPSPTATVAQTNASPLGKDQITAALQIVVSVNKGQIARETGAAALQLGFGLSPDAAQALLGPANFEASQALPPPPMMPPAETSEKPEANEEPKTEELADGEDKPEA